MKLLTFLPWTRLNPKLCSPSTSPLGLFNIKKPGMIFYLFQVNPCMISLPVSVKEQHHLVTEWSQSLSTSISSFYFKDTSTLHLLINIRNILILNWVQRKESLLVWEDKTVKMSPFSILPKILVQQITIAKITNRMLQHIPWGQSLNFQDFSLKKKLQDQDNVNLY